MAAHRYWRLYITGTAGTYIGISEIELRSAAGGADLTGTGTASHSTALGGWESSKAVDNNTGTAWATYPAVSPQWWAYDFGSGAAHDLAEVKITPRTDGFFSEAPRDFRVEYSDDGAAWTVQRAFVGVVWPSASPQTFSLAVPPAAGIRTTQVALETAHAVSAAADLRATQGALEQLYVRPNTVWATQVCLEVLFPAEDFPEPPEPTPGRRNHTWWGCSFMGTGHGFNASFND